MNRWFNPSHPQTLQAAVILGYMSAVFGLLASGGNLLRLALVVGVGAGAFGSANNKRWGYFLLAISAVLIAAFDVLALVDRLTTGNLKLILVYLNQTVFPMALAVAAIHPSSRQYQKVWFE